MLGRGLGCRRLGHEILASADDGDFRICVVLDEVADCFEDCGSVGEADEVAGVEGTESVGLNGVSCDNAVRIATFTAVGEG